MTERNRRNALPSRGGVRSRRSLLAAGASVAVAAAAGCLDSALNASASSQRIEPVEPSEPREGTPEEFYHFLEANGIDVVDLYRTGNDLELTYRSGAETIDESNEEIGIVYQLFAQALVLRGSDVELLLAELTDPIDGQPRGWGLNATWIEQREAGEIDDGALWGAIVDSMVFDEGENEDEDELKAADGDAEGETEGDADGRESEGAGESEADVGDDSDDDRE